MNLNRLPGQRDVLMQQAGSDGDNRVLAGGIYRIVGKTTGIIDDLLDVEKLKQIFPANNTWGHSTLYKRDNLIQLLSEDGIEDCLELPSEDEINFVKKYYDFCDNQDISLQEYQSYEQFQIFEVFFQAYVIKNKGSSNQEALNMQNFMIYFIGGGDEQYKNNFSVNLHLDLEKYFGLIDQIIQKFVSCVQKNDINNIKIELSKLKVLADLSTMICTASQVDPERKQQIPIICKKIREVREKVQSQLLHTQDSEVLLKGAYFSYAISRDVLNHSHTTYVDIKEGEDEKTIEGKFFETVAEMRTAYEDLKSGCNPKWLDEIILGNMSIFIGVFLNKLRENISGKQINIVHSLPVKVFLGFVKNLKSKKIQDQLLEIEQSIKRKQLSPESILELISSVFRFIGSQSQGENVFETFDQGNEIYIHGALTRLQRKKSSSSINVDKIEFEGIHNILLYGADFNNEFLVKVLDSLLLLNTFHEYDIEMVRIKIIDIILKRLISKDLLTQESVEKVLRHLEYESKSYRLISVYPRLYLTLAMHFAPRDKIRAYSFYYKAEQMLACSKIHINKYGFSYEKFAHILKHTGDDAVESFLLEYNSFVKGYSKVQISDFSDFLEKLKKEKYLNRDVILSYLKNNVFFGICDIDFSDINTVSERNDCNSKILKLDQNKTLLMVYPKEYEEAFLKLYEGSSEYLKTLYKMAQDALALDDYEIRRLEVLEQAMQENRLVPFYQPKLSTTPSSTTGKCEIVGWEALMRIVTEENGSQVIAPFGPINNGDKPEYFNPELYVEAARKKGKVGALTMYMLEKIHSEMQQFWEHNSEKKTMKTAINMDARDLLEDEFFYRFTEFFIQNKKAAKILSFELLENAWTDAEEEMIIHKLIELKQRFNLSFSLDDYGKGGANMVRLQKLLSAEIIQEVKLDPMLITAIGKTGTLIEAQIQTIGVEMIVKQAEAVEAKVTAEKVDSGLLMRLLKNMGVHTVQGFDTSGKPQRIPSTVPTLKQEKN